MEINARAYWTRSVSGFNVSMSNRTSEVHMFDHGINGRKVAKSGRSFRSGHKGTVHLSDVPEEYFDRIKVT
jgi:hypothetical protein